MTYLKSFIRWLISVCSIAAVVVAAYYFAQPKPIQVDMATIGRSPMVVTVDEDGRTRIKERYVVSAPLSGRLLRVELEPGDDVVQSSTRLAAIAPRNPELLDTRELQQAEMQVKAREAALVQSRPAVKRAKASLDFSKNELERIRKLVPTRAATRSDLDRAVMDERVNEENYRSAFYAQHIAKYELELAKAALLRTQTNDAVDTSDFELFSPINGRVLRVLQESATVVTPGLALIEVGDLNELEVVVDVLSSDAVKIEVGARVLLERWGGETPLVGKVRLIEPSAFTKVSALGVEEQRVNVVIDIESPIKERTSLGDGFRIETRIVVWEKDEVLTVPSGALFRDGDNWAVFLVKDGEQASLRHVKIGKQNDSVAHVLDGLSVADVVILHPSDKVVAGAQVTRR